MEEGSIGNWESKTYDNIYPAEEGFSSQLYHYEWVIEGCSDRVGWWGVETSPHIKQIQKEFSTRTS